jgi:hypothetical protein
MPLWPPQLVAGLLPAAAALLAFELATQASLVPACNPFIEGCVAISRAARHDLPNHLFRALVLAAAQVLHTAGGARLRRSAIALAAIGVAAGIALVLYGSFLGTEGATYRWLRRHGTLISFGGTCLAMLLLGRALQRLRDGAVLALPHAHGRALLVLFAAIVALGLGNALAGLWADAALKDRIENATEWWGSLGLTLAFVVIASLWRRLGVRRRLEISRSDTAAPPDR